MTNYVSLNLFSQNSERTISCLVGQTGWDWSVANGSGRTSKTVEVTFEHFTYCSV